MSNERLLARAVELSGGGQEAEIERLVAEHKALIADCEAQVGQDLSLVLAGLADDDAQGKAWWKANKERYFALAAELKEGRGW